MKLTTRAALAGAVAIGLAALSACAELAAITEGVMIACENDPVGCDEVFFSGKTAPQPVDPSRW
ncbi:MAG: hypothetical protein B7Y90_00715 [Alphaproteobacteria bacterium 32-64-14]|nr:MAG: hypothetical protein B7Y90_00715 [Alphaproteobacteria bacterium 32-64-14]